MPRRRHSEERIIYALKQIEGGAKGLEMCRELGISEATLYNWKKRYAGMGVSELRRLKQLEDENHRLRGLVADLPLISTFCRTCCEKSPKARAPSAAHLSDHRVV
jgi:putative transposase